MNTTYSRPLSLKVVDLNTAKGTFSGHAAVFHNEDLNGDIIEPGAFKATLAVALQTKAKTGSNLLMPLLWMHDPTKPVGMITSAREDAKGLYIEGQCDLNTELGRMAFSGLQQGYANAFSIGYDTVKATRDQKGIRHLLEVRLGEVSVITSGFAANQQALVTPASVKSFHHSGGQRVPLGPVHNPTPYTPSREPAIPQPHEYASDRLYREAFTAWLEKRNSVGLPTEAEQNAADFKQAIALDTARRLQNGTATLSERIAYTRATGRTPDGRRLDDDTERVNRAYDAIYQRLNEAG